jgi:CPA1 family monovalent cation:H+ antiporter
MSFYDLSAVLVTLAAFFSYVNYRYIRLPTTIGLMALSLTLSLVLLFLGKAGPFFWMTRSGSCSGTWIFMIP